MKKILYSQLLEQIPVEVKKILTIFLQEEADSIRLVGGCVRDMIAGRKVKDFDFATKFLPQKTIEILERNKINAVPTGVKFGTITAVIDGKHFEITTLRQDQGQDGRHCEPQFIDDYFFDAARRDFTINALYLDNEGFVHDYFDGISDLKNNIVKFIGDANERIKEDYLRILRFFRFSCRYSSSIDIVGLKACVAQKNGIKSLSADRIRNEVFNILENSENEKLLWILHEIEKVNLAEEIFVTKIQIEHLQKLMNLEEAFKIKLSSHVKFAALILQKNINLAEILTHFNFSNNEKKYYQFLFAKTFHILSFDIKTLRELLFYEEKEMVRDLYLLGLIRNHQEKNESEKILQYIKNFSAPKFPVNGNDLLEVGVAGGKQMGEALARLQKIWIDSDFAKTKDELMGML